MPLQSVMRLIYPPHCLTCDALTEDGGDLCPACWAETRFVTGLACDLCGAPLPGQSDRAEHCDECLALARPWTAGRAALVYSGIGRSAVLKLKHADRTDIAPAAARWMARAGADLLDPTPLIVPVPLHRGRLRSRRYNQSALLARELARLAGCDWSPDALWRRRATRTLDGHGREARFAALDGAIVPHPARGDRLSGREIVIVDDVMTSGATLAASAEAAIAAGASRVSVLVLARVTKDT